MRWRCNAHKLGQIDEAIALYVQALAIMPERVEILVNWGNALAHQGRADEAVAAYRRAIAIAPNVAEIRNILGSVLGQQQKLERGRGCLSQGAGDRAQFRQPPITIWAISCASRAATAEAAASYRRALAIKPDFSNAHCNMSAALWGLGEIAEGCASYSRHAELLFQAGRHRSPEAPPPHKLRHDQEQRDYLAASGFTTDSIDTAFRLADGERLPGPAVNPANAAEIAEQWRTTTPQIVVIDNLLTQEALEKLRRFCWGSNVWRRVYDDGYLGAMPEYGFACPLLAQIAEELRDIFPDVIGDHTLRYLWGFKYDSSLKGINIHADKAAVNVNFWIIPDEANLDPEHGGLVVWDVDAPPDWEPGKYNGDTAASREFLARAGAKPVTIPYRANRAVIFDSDLFHETDKFSFKDGYQNRRINLTLLYGDRA